MISLYLLRHAKSDWSDITLSDHDRPLNDRGEVAAGKIGAHLAGLALKPDRVICSTAARTRKTLSLVSAAGGFSWPTVYDDQLYLAGTGTLLDIIHAQPDGARSILLVGHNPGLHDLSQLLVKDAFATGSLRRKLPTGGFVELSFDVAAFADVTPRSGDLVRFNRPKEL